jgi:hypothetical protein
MWLLVSQLHSVHVHSHDEAGIEHNHESDKPAGDDHGDDHSEDHEHDHEE